ncbi:hypothetical protein MLD38_002353 [Melastoma candidum]|uniref:Uncharacterized protein n=1 Tax=Melastoma candidum TaxID=119954 RepID=A0ACB9RYI8_9MYRT|nr:hypothetical protein MLD38_002353 [Melastoma candidum]
MRLHRLPLSSPMRSSSIHSWQFAENSWHYQDFARQLLDRRWAFPGQDPRIDLIKVRRQNQAPHGDGTLLDRSWYCVPSPALGDRVMGQYGDDAASAFFIVRDDLVHPLINGNKARKLDAVLPLLEDFSVTDVVTCGGCQSAHTAAVAVACAERRLKAHLLLRGEQPEILTGYNLISTMYGSVTYVPRSLYANRQEMLEGHAILLAGEEGSVSSLTDVVRASLKGQSRVSPNNVLTIDRGEYSKCSRNVAIINEGAGDSLALLGVMRLVYLLSHDHLLGKKRIVKLVVDAGTGTTAVGLGLGVACMGLPWEVTAVMLADAHDKYREREKQLMAEFRQDFDFNLGNCLDDTSGGMVQWVERCTPRKFGKIKRGEIEECRGVARETGILVDPVYTLAAWEKATLLSEEWRGEDGGVMVVMLHTGGTLGLFGLAQRYNSHFQ